jgi:hypothetical protein
MKKVFTLVVLCIISFDTIHAEISWTLSDDGILTISGTDMPDYDTNNNIYSPWYSQRNNIKKVIIENGVKNIGKSAFYYCSCLTSISIPESVTNIGNSAFYVCSGLTSITIPNSVTSIGMFAFSSCSSLTSITIPNSVTEIGYSAFQNCSGLTSISIPNSVTSIGAIAFWGCSGLNTIIVEKGNEKYDSRDNCNAIIETGTNTLVVGCNNTIIPNSVTSILYYAFSGCSNLASATLGNSVTNIGSYAFYNCSSLKSIIIPNSVTIIGDFAFRGCSGLATVSIGNSVVNIGQAAFSSCSVLTSVNIGNSVNNIARLAFEGCSGLTSITCYASTPPNCDVYCFRDVNKTIPIYVPANSIEEYKSANEWKDFTNIQAIPTTYTLLDDEEYTNKKQRDIERICYIRNFFNTKWQALYIPFSLSYDDWKNDFEVAYINGIRQYDKNDDGAIDETIMDIIKIKEGSLIPNNPYLIKAKSVGEKTISLTNATLYPAEENSIDCRTTIAEYTFTGTYSAIPSATLIANRYYAMGGGELIISDGSNDLKPYRWYMRIDARSPMYNTSNAAKAITINVVGEESETTGICQLQMNNDKLPVCDLNGRRVSENSLKPGVYIKNGKKVIIK